MAEAGRRTHYRSCSLCEATCGIVIETEGDRVLAIRGDADDPISRGYLCPKATALADLHADPDRLRRPVVRDGDRWRELDWDAAFDLVARRIQELQRVHGKDAIAVYQGNPTGHNLGLLTFGQLALRKLGTRNCYSATSADQLPHLLAALSLFGDALFVPVPDIDRTDYFVCIGGNPVVSNGSIMTAPDMRGRLKALRARGGTLVVIDPRRTETAELADRHHFIRPGSDGLLLMAMVHAIFAERLARPGRVGAFVDGIAELEAAARAFSPEATAAATGIAAGDVTRLVRELAAARGVVYGRLGVCTQEFGGVNAWLVVAINLLLGRLDEPGGMMFPTPAVDLEPLMRSIGFHIGFDRYRSRVRGLPEFGGELPVVTLAEEMDTPGPGQVRGFVCSAGNPVLSTPNGARLDRALAKLDFMVAIDPYINETTRHAHVILPPTSALEHSHYDLGLATLGVRNFAKYAGPVFEPGPEQRSDAQIMLALFSRLGLPKLVGRALRPLLARLEPEHIIGLALRAGRYQLTLDQLRASPHGIDLGPLQPRLPDRLRTADRRIQIAPARYLADLPRLQALLAQPVPELVLIGRRHLRSNNSWCHNSPRLVKGKARCTLLIHPTDAVARGISDGDVVELASTAGAVRVPAEVSDEIMPGVVSLPHGWGHGRTGTHLAVANAAPGASANDVTSEALFDALSGTAALSGLSVRVTPRAADSA